MRVDCIKKDKETLLKTLLVDETTKIAKNKISNLETELANKNNVPGGNEVTLNHHYSFVSFFKNYPLFVR